MTRPTTYYCNDKSACLPFVLPSFGVIDRSKPLLYASRRVSISAFTAAAAGPMMSPTFTGIRSRCEAYSNTYQIWLP